MRDCGMATYTGMGPFVWIDAHTLYAPCNSRDWDCASLIPNPKACVRVLVSLASKRANNIGKFVHELAHGDKTEIAWLKALLLASLVTIPTCEASGLPEEGLHTLSQAQHQDPTRDVRILRAVSADQSRTDEIRKLLDDVSDGSNGGRDKLKCWAITALTIGDINFAGGIIQSENSTFIAGLKHLEVRRQPFVKLLNGVGIHEWCSRMECGDCIAATHATDERSRAGPSSKEPLLQQLISELEAGTADDRIWLRKLMWDVACTYTGTRILQKAIEVCAAETKRVLLHGFEGNVWAACCSPHANFMLQACMRWMPADAWQHFVLRELSGHYVEAAKSDFGCRVLQRLMEHCNYKDLKPLIDEVVNDKQTLRELIQHRFGNYVVQHIFEHDSEEGRQQQKVVEELCVVDVSRGQNIYELARHRVASHVLDASLRYCKPACLCQVVEAMLSDSKQLHVLRDCQFGSFVWKNLHQVLEQALSPPPSSDEGLYRCDLVVKALRRNSEVLGILKLSQVALSKVAQHPVASSDDSVAWNGTYAPLGLWLGEAQWSKAQATWENHSQPAGFVMQAGSPWPEQQLSDHVGPRHSRRRARWAHRRARKERESPWSGEGTSAASGAQSAAHPFSSRRHLGRARHST